MSIRIPTDSFGRPSTPATMLGYKENQSVDDFVDSLTGTGINTYTKGKQVSLFCFEGTPSMLSDYPVALEGDFIVNQEYEMENGEWQNLELFSEKAVTGFITCYILPFGLTGNLRIVYGKYLNDPSRVKKEDTDFTKSLKEIDSTKKTQEFQKANFSSSPSKSSNKKTYRIVSPK